MAEPDAEYTVDELAVRAGVTVRTVRFYAGRSLLPPPRLRGRVGLYGPVHLARLELIRELQALGFTLAAVERHLQRIPDDASAEELALQRALLTPWVAETREEVELHELSRRAGRHLDEDTIEQLVSLGVLERTDGTGFTLLNPTLLANGLEIIDLGMPPEMLHAAKKVVERHVVAMAAELQELFADNVLRPYVEQGRPAGERERVRQITDKLKPVTIQALVSGFERAVNHTLRRKVSGADS